MSFASSLFWGHHARLFIILNAILFSGYFANSAKTNDFVPQAVNVRVRNELRNFDSIQTMEVDEYLEGVLAGEIPAAWPIEVLKAQAIVSRTYALASKKAVLESTVADQVYSRFLFDKLSPLLQNKIRKAILMTQGQYLSFDGVTAAPIHFHAHCGGHTEAANEVWAPGGSEKEVGVPDKWCGLGENTKDRWSYRLPISNIQEKLRSRFYRLQNPGIHLLQVLSPGAESFSTTKQLAVNWSQAEVTKSLRVNVLPVVWTDSMDTIFSVTGEWLRKSFGYNKIKSTRFLVQSKSDSIEFSGKGHGHGVGMCQNGGRWMAESGRSARAILLHYYPLAHIRRKL
jgi:stage II sporulation protein D